MFPEWVVEELYDLTRQGNKHDAVYLRYLRHAFKVPRASLMMPAFKQPKKTGFRTIVPAGPILAFILHVLSRWIKKNLSGTLDNCASGRNVNGAVEPHLGFKYAVTLDLASAFDHVSAPLLMNALSQHFPAVKVEVLEALVYLLTFLVYKGKDAVIPQGCESSSWAFNLVLFRADQVILAYARKLGLNYSRYCDNLCFSSGAPFNQKKVVAQIKAILAGSGFEVGSVEYYSEFPICFLGTDIHSDFVAVAEDKITEYIILLDEAYASPTPEVYRDQITGIWLWFYRIMGDGVYKDVMRLFQRYYEKVRSPPPTFQKVLNAQLTKRLM